MVEEKLFGFSLDHCPHCGMEGTIRLFQALGKPNRISCCFCYKPIYDVEIINTYFDPEKVRGSFMEHNERFQKQQEHKKELEEIKSLKKENYIPCKAIKASSLISEATE